MAVVTSRRTVAFSHGPGTGAGRTPIGLRCLLAVYVGRLAGFASRLLGYGQGGTLPGRVALALAPDALRRLAQGRRIVLVSGTNGKSTTTKLLSTAMSATGRVITNPDGSNLVAGLTTALLLERSAPFDVAVLEVDEVALPAALVATSADVLCLLNLSRDQLDRMGEVASHVPRWSRAIAGATQTTVVANADDPLVVAAVLGARPAAEDVVWVAVGQPWRLDFPVCPRCSEAWRTTPTTWSCASCGLARPQPMWSLDGKALQQTGGARYDLSLRLTGRANAANAAIAAVAAGVMHVPVQVGLDKMRTVSQIDGRNLVAQVGAATVRLVLAKNPAGWLEALGELPQDASPVIVAINAQPADGRDPSWLWDVPFEVLRGRTVIACGERAADLAVRLRYAEVEHQLERDLDRALALLPAGPGSLLANYTSFVKARTSLQRVS